MNITSQIQIAVARVDLLVCQLLALPWKRMAASLLMAWWVIHLIKAVKHDG